MRTSGDERHRSDKDWRDSRTHHAGLATAARTRATQDGCGAAHEGAGLHRHRRPTPEFGLARTPQRGVRRDTTLRPARRPAAAAAARPALATSMLAVADAATQGQPAQPRAWKQLFACARARAGCSPGRAGVWSPTLARGPGPTVSESPCSRFSGTTTCALSLRGGERCADGWMTSTEAGPNRLLGDRPAI